MQGLYGGNHDTLIKEIEVLSKWSDTFVCQFYILNTVLITILEGFSWVEIKLILSLHGKAKY
jgi:hypothetical protein